MLILLYDEVWPGTLTNVREGKSKNEKQGRVDRREVSFIFLLTIFFEISFLDFLSFRETQSPNGGRDAQRGRLA